MRVSGRIKTPLVRLLRLFLVVQPRPQIAQNLPLKPRLAIRDVLGLEMRDFGAEDGPYAQILRETALTCQET